MNDAMEYLKHPVFNIITDIIDHDKSDTFVVGGYVRDLLLRRECKDIDIVTTDSGIELAKQVAERIGENTHISIFKNFGTAMLKCGDYDIEFVGARKESYKKESRKPAVEKGSLDDDLSRRDFTINALAICLNKNHMGDWIDNFNGIQDLHDRIIRTPTDPDITFSDDPLRMMRAIRFATQLDFTVEEETLNAIKRNKERISIISKERIHEELHKIIISPIPSKGFHLLDKTGLLEIILPDLYRMKGIEKKNHVSHKDNFIHSLKVLDNISKRTNNLWLRWAALLHDIAKPFTKKFDPVNGWTFYGHEYYSAKMIPEIFKTLKLPLNDKMKYVQKLVGLHMRPISLAEEEVTDSAVRRLLFETGNDIDDLMTLCEADITSANRDKIELFLQNFQKVRQKLKEVEEKDAIRNFQPPVSGEEIMSVFNIGPSSEVGVIKKEIKEAILDGKIHNNYEEAYRYMLEQGKKLGLKPVKKRTSKPKPK